MKTRLIVSLVAVVGTTLVGCSTSSVLELEPGACFNVSFEATEISRVPTVDCAKAHDAEVFHVFDLPDMVYDEESVFYAAGEVCLDVFEDYVGIDFFDPEVEHLDLYTMYPLSEGWKNGDHGIVCSIVMRDPTKQLTGSQKNAFAQD